MDITDWRRKIDEIDTAMLHLLSLRAELAIEVGRMKSLEGVALRAPARERAIITRLKRMNPGPLDGPAIAKIYAVILAESIRTQQRHGGSRVASKINRAARVAHARKKRR
jgi:chorismate mutase/prephenate dehydratase